jgi:large subunit ribosomal protein L2
MSREGERAVVLLPSGKKKVFSARCLATVGSVAGSGRVDKPFVKAGAKFHKLHALGKRYPTVRGVAMNPVDHPFGGSAHPGKQKSISRNAPPGRKVGSISPSRVGKRKRKK